MVSHGPERKSPFGGMTRPGRRGNMGLPDFPPTSPRHLRRPFSAATGSGRFAFLGTPAHSRCADRNAETLGMGAAVAHEISPELVLVCPELRAHALTLLPALDPDELFAVRPAPRPTPVAPVVEPPRLVLVEAGPTVAVEPERTVGVDPERRPPLPVALAAYTTEALFLGAVRGAALTAVIAAVAFVLAR